MEDGVDKRSRVTMNALKMSLATSEYYSDICRLLVRATPFLRLERHARPECSPTSTVFYAGKAHSNVSTQHYE